MEANLGAHFQPHLKQNTFGHIVWILMLDGEIQERHGLPAHKLRFFGFDVYNCRNRIVVRHLLKHLSCHIALRKQVTST